MSTLRVAMVAPPWLAVPPSGYGGVENVIAALVPELQGLGVEVELFTIGISNLPNTKKHWLYKEEQYSHMHKPQYDSMPISVAHLLFALNTIREDGDFDLIHDHNGFLGPLLFGHLPDLPPIIHTLHGPPFTTPDRLELGIPDNLLMWRQFKAMKNTWIVPISRALIMNAPRELRPHILSPVHNMVGVDQFPFVAKKGDYFMTLARFHPEKGQHLAIKACQAQGEKLKMAGAVASITDARKVTMELANPLSHLRSVIDFRYFSDQIFPHLGGDIEHVGEVKEGAKLKLISKARALLFPIQWDEPFGMVLLEAMACGTPVVAMRRGAIPEIVEHGVNGFIADNFTQFKQYMARIGDIDPAACRNSVERSFSARTIAKRYVQRYQQAIALAKANLSYAAK